jgi:hypothetical protein
VRHLYTDCNQTATHDTPQTAESIIPAHTINVIKGKGSIRLVFRFFFKKFPYAVLHVFYLCNIVGRACEDCLTIPIYDDVLTTL